LLNDRGDATTFPIAVVPPPAVAAPKEVIEGEDPMEVVPEQEAPVVHEVMLADAKPKLL
jgi:hypothetical protein